MRLKTIIYVSSISVSLALFGNAPPELDLFLQEKRDFSLFEEKDNLVAVAVIGSGPAALSAAFVTAKEKIPTVVFEGKLVGGPLNSETNIGNWPGFKEAKGFEVMIKLMQQADGAGVVHTAETIVSVDFSTWPYILYTDTGKTIAALSIIIATGADPCLLEIPGEKEYFGNGIHTYLYKKDASQLNGKKVAVIGGGTDAISKTCYLAESADVVYLLVRGKNLQKERWKKRLMEKNKKNNIHVIYEAEVRKVLGDGSQIQGIEILCKGNYSELDVDNVVLAAGVVPNSKLFQPFIECDEKGYIVLNDRSQSTSLKGVFAAGSVAEGRYRQAAISIGDGMKAGYDAANFFLELSLNEEEIKKIVHIKNNY